MNVGFTSEARGVGEMTTWLPCPEGYIAADVIRWREGIWERRSPRQKKAECVGNRNVVAEVLAEPDDDGFVTLLVRACALLPRRAGEDAPKTGALKIGEPIRRKHDTLLRGQVERMAWPDGEGVRLGIVGSRFMRPATVPSVSQGRKPRGNEAVGGRRTGVRRSRRDNSRNQDRDKSH